MVGRRHRSYRARSAILTASHQEGAPFLPFPTVPLTRRLAADPPTGRPADPPADHPARRPAGSLPRRSADFPVDPRTCGPTDPRTCRPAADPFTRRPADSPASGMIRIGVILETVIPSCCTKLQWEQAGHAPGTAGRRSNLRLQATINGRDRLELHAAEGRVHRRSM